MGLNLFIENNRKVIEYLTGHKDYRINKRSANLLKNLIINISGL